MKKIKNICEVCDCKKQVEFLNLGKQPLCDDLIRINSKKINKKYETKLSFCKECFTVHQIKQVNKKVLFPKNYHYRARFTQDVLDGMKDFTNEITKLINKKKIILDIGCNDGSLLNEFKKKGFKTIGVEPTNAAKDAKKKHEIINDYFSKDVAKKIKSKYGIPSAIVFTNVFAHISNLNQLIQNLKILLKKETIIVIENHYLGSVIDQFQFDTFYHEHPRTYSLKSFKYISKKLGGKIFKVEFPKRYSGNIRVFIKHKENFSIKDNKINYNKENYFFKKINTFQKKLNKWKIFKKKQLINLKAKYGILYGKAFPGRASIIINFLGLNSSFFEATFEKPGSLKNGHYVPGTRIKIISEKLLKKISKKNILINFAWHIEKEIKIYLKKKGYNFKIINIFNKNEI
jgi:2-polyprenyl-3-methyl-5-hydroxy-6-metoxy-1,4-benzoquinol methylase